MAQNHGRFWCEENIPDFLIQEGKEKKGNRFGSLFLLAVIKNTHCKGYDHAVRLRWYVDGTPLFSVYCWLINSLDKSMATNYTISKKMSHCSFFSQ